MGIGTKPDSKKALDWHFQLSKAGGPDRFNDGLVSCLAAGTGDKKLEDEVKRWLENNATSHSACQNMLLRLAETSGEPISVKKHAAGVGWISEDDELHKA